VRVLLAGGLLAVLAACGGPPAATPSPTPPAGPASPVPSRRPTPSRAPSPTPSPAVTGSPMTTAGAYLRLVPGGRAVAGVAACEEAYPELLDVSCDDVAMDGGTLLWVAGTLDAGGGARRWVLRLLTFEAAAGGFLARYEAADPAGGWGGFRVGAARLTGYGVDGLVAQVVHQGSEGRRGYDLLTWRTGGPLVLRAHRPAAPQLRVVARENRLDDYEAAGGRFLHRQVRWDGARFVSVQVGRVPAGQAPPPG
jgi:hypothetical protein